jgi:hypothetical protein
MADSTGQCSFWVNKRHAPSFKRSPVLPQYQTSLDGPWASAGAIFGSPVFQSALGFCPGIRHRMIGMSVRHLQGRRRRGLLCDHLALRGILVILANEIVTAGSEWTEAHNALRFACYYLFDL